MIQISNLDDGKSEWNMNETHIIIPMIDEDVIANKETEKISTNVVTLNTLDNADQAILTNGLEHSLVIGLDRNLFETHNKNDLFVIQNSDLKLLSCTPDMKTPVTYTVSYVDQDRNAILWESQVLKDKMTKSEWCLSEKTIFEVKDVLNCDDSEQDSSKNWRDDLVKSEDQINLDDDDDVGSDLTSQVAKILIPVENGVNDGKKLVDDMEKDAHFIVNYYPSVQNCESVSLMQNSVVEKSMGDNKKLNLMTFNNKNELPVEKSKSGKIISSVEFKKSNEDIIKVVPEQATKETDDSHSTSIFNQFEKHVENELIEPSQKKNAKLLTENIKQNASNNGSLPEKSLPLKKKAKMKRTISSAPENSRLSTKQESRNTQQSPILKKYIEDEKNPSSNSDSDEPLINKIKKRKKFNKIKNNHKEEMSGLVRERSPIESFSSVSCGVDEKNQLDSTKPTNIKIFKNNLDFEKKNFNSIYDLVNELKKCKLINTSVWQILNSGLKDMNVDILKEMQELESSQSTSINNLFYSAQLKAFALVLYFKQPAAFNHISSLYKNGWPSLKIIKEWKSQLNSHQRPGFVGARRELNIN